MRTAKSRNKHVAKISCNKVVMALLKLLCVDADLDNEYTQARIPLWLYHRVLISPFSSKSAQRKNYVSVKVEWVATVKFSLTWQMSTFCGLPSTYTIKLCSTSSWNGEDCIRGICIAGYIWEWDTADLSADELKNNQARRENGFCGRHG